MATLEERIRNAQATRVTSTPTSSNLISNRIAEAQATRPTQEKTLFPTNEEVIAERAQRSRDTWVQEDTFGKARKERDEYTEAGRTLYERQQKQKRSTTNQYNSGSAQKILQDNQKREKYDALSNDERREYYYRLGKNGQEDADRYLLSNRKTYKRETKPVEELPEDYDTYTDYAESGLTLYERMQQKKKNQQEASGFSTEAGENQSVQGIRLGAMTNDERQMYYYQLAKGGQEAADNYLQNISPQLNARLAAQEAQEIRSMPSGIGKALRYGAQSVMAGVDQASKGIAQALTGDVYDNSQTAITSGMIGSELSGLKRSAYNAGVSIGNMLPAVTVSLLTHGAGAPALLANAASGLTTALGSGGNAYGEAIKEGYDETAARTYGTLIGAAEAAIGEVIGGVSALAGQGISLTEKLVSKVSGIENGLARWALSQGIRIGAEVNEEEVQNFLEPLFRTVIFGEDYDAPTIQELVDTAITTAISTGIMNFGQSTPYNPTYDAAATATDRAMMDTLAGRETAENPNVTQETDLDRVMVETFQQNQKSNIDNAANNPYNKTDKGGVTDGHTDQLDGTSETGVRERPDGYQSGRGTQDGTAYDGRGNLQLSGIVLLSPESQQTLAQRGIVNVGLHDSSTDNAAFSAALDAARAADRRNGWAVTPKSAEELTQSGTKSYMNQNGSTGFAIAPDGDIEAVFANKAAGAPKGATKSTIPQAIALGGNKLDCYGGGLVSIYSKYGFEPVARVAFNPEYANDGWTADKGSPDIYFMMHNGDSADTVVQNMDSYKRWTAADLEALPVMDYDTAYQYRDFLLEQRRRKPTAESSVGAAEAGFDPYSHALNEYGAIEAGENPARVVDVPKSVDGKKKVSKFARTAMEASITTDEMVSKIEQLVVDGKLDHNVYTDKQAIQDGTAAVVHEYERGKSVEQIRSEFVRDAERGKAGKKLVAKGLALYADAVADNDYRAAADILVGLTAIETNAGQTVQAARLLKSQTPEGRVFTAQKMVSNIEAQINKGRAVDKQIEIDLPDNLLEAYKNAKTQESVDAAMGDIYDYVAEKYPTSLSEALTQWRYFSMLFNPSTHLKNIIGNFGGLIAKIGKDNLAALGENILIGDKEGRTKAFLNPMKKSDQELIAMAWNDYDTATELFDKGSKYGRDMSEINSRRRYWKINDPKTKAGKLADTVLAGAEWVKDRNSTWLESEDMWFSKPQYAAALAGYMKANHQTEITDAARTYAMTEAKRGTFNDLNTVSRWATNLGGDTKLGKFIAGIAYPFKKVPANVMVRTVEYSPLGVAKGIYELANMHKNPDITAAQVIDTFAASASGSALMGIGYLLAKEGLLRATGLGDEKEREQQKTAFGAKDFSFIKSDGGFVPIDVFTLAGTSLLTGAQLFESIQNMKNGDDIDFASVLDALSKITDPVFEQSMLTGISDIIRTIQYSGTDTDIGELAVKVGIQMAGNYLGQYVPTLIRRIASSLDEYQRTSYVEPDGAWAPVQTTAQNIQKGIPFARENMLPTRGNWGVLQEGNGANGVLSAIGNAVTPIYTSEAKTDEVEEEILRLYQVDKEYSNFYKKPPKHFTVDKEDVKLTSEQYDRYVEADGRIDHNVREAMLHDDVYKSVPDAVKNAAMSLSEEYANELGKVAAGVGYEAKSWVQALDGKSDEEIAHELLGKAIDNIGGLTSGADSSYFSDEKYSGVPADVSEKSKAYADAYTEAMAKQDLGYDVETKWIQETAALESDAARADYFTLKASSETGTKLADQTAVAEMQKQLANPVYTGMSSDIMGKAGETAAAYYEALAKEQYGQEPEKWVTEAKGKSQKELADLFVERAVESTLNKMDGGKYDDLNTLYDSGDINDATVIAVLSADTLDKWTEYGKGKGVNVGDLLDIQQFYNSDASKGEKDANGKDIKGKTKQDKVIAWIDSKDLTNQQKDAWFCCLYSAKNSPWKWAR